MKNINRILVLDLETTGLIKPIQPIEMAYMALDYPSLEVLDSYESKYKPDKPIELGALMVSHILLSELEDERSWELAVNELPRDVEYVIGHNVQYDTDVLGITEEVRIIDTKTLAKALVPGLDSYSQSALIYYFFGDAARAMLKEAHTAMADIQNNLLLFKELIKLIEKREDGFSILESIESLWDFNEECKIPTELHFGKYKGQAYSVMVKDAGWLNWWFTKSDTPPDAYQIEAIRRAGVKV